MNRMLFASVAAIVLLASGPSFAQSVGVQVGTVGAGINFAPEERTRIKEYVVKERVPRTVVRERVTVGGTYPKIFDRYLSRISKSLSMGFPALKRALFSSRARSPSSNT